MLRADKFNRFPDRIVSEPVEVRLAKAKDCSSTPALLEVLSRDTFWYVRDYVAANIHTPKHCLETLKDDSDFRVRAEAIKTLARLGYSEFVTLDGLDDKIAQAKTANTKCSDFATTHTQTYHTR